MRITGLTEHQVSSTIRQLRERLATKPSPPQAILQFRILDRKTSTFTYVHSLERTNREYLRVMRPTCYTNVTGRPVYEWRLVEAGGRTKMVTFRRNALGNGFSPFDGKGGRIDWARHATIIGTIWERRAGTIPSGGRSRS